MYTTDIYNSVYMYIKMSVYIQSSWSRSNICSKIVLVKSLDVYTFYLLQDDLFKIHW